MPELSAVLRRFAEEHQDEFVNGKLKISIGGGAGFIGSHLAQRFKKEVRLLQLCAIFMAHMFCCRATM